MKPLHKRLLSLLLVLSMLFCMALTACTPKQPSDPDDTTPPKDDPQDQIPEDEYFLPKEEGYNQLTLYWSGNTDLSKADVWIWWGDKAGQGYVFHPCAYGAKVVVNVPVGIDEVGFIVRRDCSEPGGSSWGSATKDYDQDRFAILEGEETIIYLKSGDPAQYSSQDGGKTLTMIKKFSLAEMTDFHSIKYNVTPKTKITSFDQIKIYQDGRPLTIQAVSSMNRDSVNGVITVKETLDISKEYTIEIEGFGQKTVVPTAVFDSDEFIADYTYDGDDLGATIQGDSTTFKVWAPTASEVKLNLFSDGHTESLIKTVSMVKGERGVWSYTEENCGHGT